MPTMRNRVARSFVLGLALAFHLGFAGNAWLHAKLLFVVLLTAFHGWITASIGRMASGLRPHSEKAFRRAGEIPAVLTVAIVVLVVVKPF